MEETKEITVDSDIFERKKWPLLLQMFMGVFALFTVLIFIYLNKDIDNLILLNITVVLGGSGSYAFFNGLLNYKEIKDEEAE